MCLHMYLSCYSHWRSFISIRSSRVRRITTNITQATRKLLTLALSKNTCHTAALFPQHGFSQVDLRGQKWGEQVLSRGEVPPQPCSQTPPPGPATSHLPGSVPSSRGAGQYDEDRKHLTERCSFVYRLTRAAHSVALCSSLLIFKTGTKPHLIALW